MLATAHKYDDYGFCAGCTAHIATTNHAWTFEMVGIAVSLCAKCVEGLHLMLTDILEDEGGDTPARARNDPAS